MACSTALASLDSELQSVLYVRRPPGDPHVDLTFTYKARQFKMHRPAEEPLGKTLKRLLVSVSKPDKHTKKRKHADHQNDQSGTIKAHLQSTDKVLIPEDTLNENTWTEGSILVVGDMTYIVHVNVPSVVSLSMPKFTVAGGAIVPEVELEFVNISACKWTWWRLPLSCDSLPPPPDLAKLPAVNNTWVHWPSEEDVGHRLAVECVPSSDKHTGPLACALSPVIMEMHKDTPITRRHLLTPARLDSSSQFRVVTYNILAEPFSNSAHAQNVLYPYCDPTALHIDYRHCLIVHELLGYNVDVMCLQECGTSSFNRYLLPALKDKGYDGCFAQKSGMIHEGEAIFFETSKFSLVSVDSTPLSTYFQTDPSCSELCTSLKAAPYFFNEVIKKHNIVLSVLLKSKELPQHYLLVATTHLYYHPKGDHVRLAQVAILLNFIKSKLDIDRRELGQEVTIATLLCGDFNSCPCIAAYNYVLSGKVKSAHQDWMVYKYAEIPKCKCTMKQEIQAGESSSDEEFETRGLNITEDMLAPLPQASGTAAQRPKRRLSTVDDFKGLDLEHSFHFENVCGASHFTNYTLGFHGILDYIFIDSDHLCVERSIPLPSLHEMSEFVALPSVYFPSDHLSLVADLKWKK